MVKDSLVVDGSCTEVGLPSIREIDCHEILNTKRKDEPMVMVKVKKKRKGTIPIHKELR